MTTSTADIVAQGAPLSESARGLLKPGTPPTQYLETLTKAGLIDDAVTFLAFALPIRFTVWWACLCSWRATGGRLSELDAAALGAAVRWVLEPSEANGRLAKEAADAAGQSNASAVAAHAAFLGGFATEGDQPSPPNAVLAAKVAHAAVLLAMAASRKAPTKLIPRQALLIGTQIGQGQVGWQP